ncbi:hypothetical protein WJX74_010774 [Apatococcus lobatus]|uniref:Uncharacterized protein n=1 Tax=Apatococcus lobatus TaxID=904363 RepID=A0AAW1SI05_9CHLO
MTNLGIMSSSSFRPTILVVHKDGRRRIENDREIFEELRQRFKAEAAIEYYDARHFSYEQLKPKVLRMARTSVLITPAGGLAQQLLFLPAGATAIMPDVLHNDLQSLPLDPGEYAHVEYVNVLRLPVTHKSYARTTDRPQCESTGTEGLALRDCNVWLEDLEPLFDMVEQGLHAWRIDHEA